MRDFSRILSYLTVIIAFAGPALASNEIAETGDWLNPNTLSTLIFSILSLLIVLYAIWSVKSGRKFKIREIPGLKAVDEAVGRATEMGSPILYTPGWGGDIQRPTTIASMNILSSVATKTAEYDTRIIYPTHDPVIMAVAQEVVKEACIKVGHPDRYRAEDIFYISSSQFGYAAAVDGIISREKPASVFLLGTFEAESLILAETGNAIGSIQIAGTDSTIQLAFFIVACDYTLIGEELFAASGYLSGNESILSSVKAQDIIKILIALFIIVAMIWATIDPSSTWWVF
ncbi:MAG: hypothetical protein CVT49_06690 [candidate division Zixibacteria bacterium HGW-Zixibacteria-1]|nr:MAG: hypothetical protein CVT49_06690 [candidate division Zixibacteria bacterium HGW-Zixibacteria-1]